MAKKALPSSLQEAIQEYWDTAYAEGLEKRNNDTPEGRAQKALAHLNEEILAYAKNLATESLKISADDLWESEEVMSLNARLGLTMTDLQLLTKAYKNLVLAKLL